MASNKIGKLKLFLVLVPIPILWILFSQLETFSPYYTPLRNMAMDWRFQVRGPVDVPEIKVVYADVDAEAIHMMGERPWSRKYFAETADILFEVGKAKAIGYDFIFSENTSSDMVPQDNIRASDLQLRRVVEAYPNIVLAANYTGVPLPLTLEQRLIDQTEVSIETIPSTIPFAKRTLENPDNKKPITPDISLPEMPTFPVIDIGMGTMGLISVDEKLSGDSVPRFVPMFAESKDPTIHSIYSMVIDLFMRVSKTTPLHKSETMSLLLAPNFRSPL